MDPDRQALERETATRAMQHDCMLYGSVSDGKVVFVWRSVGEQVGPEFSGRDLAVDWMAERLNSRERSAERES
jgi:hypothetical protein